MKVVLDRKDYVREWRKRSAEYIMFSGAKSRAKKKNIEFTLTKNDIKIPERCSVLNLELKSSRVGKSGFFNNSPSLDRIDPNKGYTKDNVRIISNRANLLKSNATIKELELILEDLKAQQCA